MHLFDSEKADTKGIYFIAFCMSVMFCMLFYEYRKAYKYNKKFKGLLESNDIKHPSSNLSYLTQDGDTFYGLNAMQVIKYIEQDRIDINTWKALNLTYSSSGLIKKYLSLMFHVEHKT